MINICISLLSTTTTIFECKIDSTEDERANDQQRKSDNIIINQHIKSAEKYRDF